MSITERHTRMVRVLYAAALLSALLGALFGSKAVAQETSPAEDEPICDDEVKYEIAKILAESPTQRKPLSQEAIAFQKKVYEKFSFCAQDANHQPPVDRREFCSRVSAVGNLGYERMPCCGYDPQKQTFGCPIRIERSTGFGAPFIGSREYVLTCVDLGGGLQPVALDTVHLSNAVSGAPPWQFAVLARANEKLASLPLDGKTLRARSILSWNLAPDSCDYKAYWGHALDYQIRLDP
jgi:hypothetical protein